MPSQTARASARSSTSPWISLCCPEGVWSQTVSAQNRIFIFSEKTQGRRAIYLVIFQHIVHNQFSHGQSEGTEDLKIIVAMVEPRTAIQDHYFFLHGAVWSVESSSQCKLVGEICICQMQPRERKAWESQWTLSAILLECQFLPVGRFRYTKPVL